MKELLKNENLARSFNFTFHYIDNVLSLNNSKFGDYVECIYPIELGNGYHRYIWVNFIPCPIDSNPSVSLEEGSLVWEE